MQQQVYNYHSYKNSDGEMHLKVHTTHRNDSSLRNVTIELLPNHHDFLVTEILQKEGTYKKHQYVVSMQQLQSYVTNYGHLIPASATSSRTTSRGKTSRTKSRKVAHRTTSKSRHKKHITKPSHKKKTTKPVRKRTI